MQNPVDLFPIGEQIIQLGLAHDVSQGRLRDVPGCATKILNLNDSRAGIDHTEENDRVYLHGNVIACDYFLRGHIERYHPQIDLHHSVDDRDDEEQAWSFRAHQTTQAKNHTAFIFLYDPDRGEQEGDH